MCHHMNKSPKHYYDCSRFMLKSLLLLINYPKLLMRHPSCNNWILLHLAATFWQVISSPICKGNRLQHLTLSIKESLLHQRQIPTIINYLSPKTGSLRSSCYALIWSESCQSPLSETVSPLYCWHPVWSMKFSKCHRLGNNDSPQCLECMLISVMHEIGISIDVSLMVRDG